MRKAAVVPAQPEHVPYLAPRLRQADKDEVWAAYGIEPLEGLTHSLALSSHAWTGTLDDEPVCMFGVAPMSILSGVAMPWFVGAPDIEQHQIAFLRRNIPMVAYMLRLYPRLFNWVDARNDKAIQWLQWLGFELQPAKPWGYLQLPFHKFELRA